MTQLRVIEIFDSLQGEGYWSGVPMTFVRLAGCNAPDLRLGCVEWCDTPASWDPDGGEELEVAQVVTQLHLPRVCLTGGEPLLQVDEVTELVAKAHACGHRVHVETNGTVDSPCDFDWVTVSPKPPHYTIAESWVGRIDELKIIVGAGFDVAAAERLAAEHPGVIVSIQPEYGGGSDDPRARAAVERATTLVMSHPDWRLSLQMHKVLGIR